MRRLLRPGARPRRGLRRVRPDGRRRAGRAATRPAAACPRTCAVGGFDDSGLAATLDPPLTTVRQPLDRISAEMVRLLLDLIAGRTPVSVTVPTTVVVRARRRPDLPSGTTRRPPPSHPRRFLTRQ